ncbi:MAG: bifunctional phosphopantothenoylcysteine decarboxylase/phosphopantothenate--cysteine ligase CoaBC [Archaeoglobaceae archaeon]
MHPNDLQKKSDKLKGKKVVLAVTGSIAAIESVKLARELVRRGAEVVGVMSNDALKIIHPYALEFATHDLVTEITGKVEHVGLLDADLLLIAPASASTISKVAKGVADTPVTLTAATVLGKMPVILVPSMHESMYDNPIIKENVERLRDLGGVEFVEPHHEEGKAKFPPIETICLHVERALYPKDMRGKDIVVTSGPTYEQIDPIRFISNKSSGLMGREIALELWRRGASITHITSHPLNLELPEFREVYTYSVSHMLDASITEVESGCDLFVSAAAPSDFVVEMNDKKMKTGETNIKLGAAPKIIKELRKFYKGPMIGFKAETGVPDEELYQIAHEKMVEDRLEMVVANDVKEKGMGTEDTRVLMLTGKRNDWSEGSKSQIAEKIVKAFVEDCL